MEVSIIIPTRNRSEKLERLLYSILTQSIHVNEVIVVDDSDDFRTTELIERLRSYFLEKGIIIRHFVSSKNEVKSISRARNLGAKKAKGDILLFLDDDVILDKNYVKKILEVFELYPTALGVQGTVVNFPYSHLENSLKKAFYYWHAEINRCRMLPSGKTTYACNLNKIISCEWLFGLNVAYRKEIFDKFYFNEKLLGYSLGEDKEFSFKIHKVYPNSLFQTPYAKVYHDNFPTKNLNKWRACIITAYPISFFYNNIEQTLKNKIVFVWSELGRIALRLLWALPNATSIKHILTSYVVLVRYIKNVKEEDYSFIFKESV
ncbi:MAG: glycosyltransferase [Candidatus Bathyarchaeota archaeon]|nr:glycosyltransferase [Candidatus Bathyarchaeota archaeon]